MNYGRKIKIAYDKLSEKNLRVEDVFKTYHEAYQVRKNYHEKKYDFSCCECGQKLEISTSKKDLVHFKHGKGTDSCILKENKYTDNEMELIKEYHFVRESDRHIYLKNEIGKLLGKEKGVKDIFIDNKVVFDKENRRRPDVLCTYKKIKLVFEIQLSKLPLKYMLGRVNFYNSKGYYLIWILDNIDLNSQNQFVKDIKYLHPSQNFFKLDEKENNFRLLCNYKTAFLSERNKLLYKWKEKSVGLNQLVFNEKQFQVYFFDFDYQDKKVKIEIEEIKEKQEKRKVEEEKELATEKAIKIMAKIKLAKKGKEYNFQTIESEISGLNEFELKIFNKKLNLKNNLEKPAIHKWIERSQDKDFNFLQFILSCNEIEYDINESDNEGNTLLFKLLSSQIRYKDLLYKHLLKRGYHINQSDKKHLEDFYNEKTESDTIITLFEICKSVDDAYLREEVMSHKRLICIIESIRQDRIIGFKYKKGQWIQFLNNAISYYNENWAYIDAALRYYDFFGKIKKLDVKGTFMKKYDEHKDSYLIRRNSKKNEYLIRRLYPELIDSVIEYY